MVLELGRIYYDDDADLSILKDKVIGCIGYGNQGTAQANNLRDSGLEVIVGSLEESMARARKDGFKTYPIEQVAEKADVILMLFPDEAQAEVYDKKIKGKLTEGKTLDFASGFNIHYGLIRPPKNVDVVMNAPRMLGFAVRELSKRGGGCATLIAVHQDYTGKAKETVLALAKGIGGTKLGAFESSFAEEVELDLFSEAAFWGPFYTILPTWLEIAAEAGYNKEIAALELYCSGEMAVETKGMLKSGMFRGLDSASTTCQYIVLSRGPQVITKEVKEKMKKALKDIKSGALAKEWVNEQKAGGPNFKKMKRKAMEYPLISETEDKLEKIRKTVLKFL